MYVISDGVLVGVGKVLVEAHVCHDMFSHNNFDTLLQKRIVTEALASVSLQE